GPSGNTVSVYYSTTNGSATSGSDYTSASGSLTFSPGQTSKTVTVYATGDTAVQPNETFYVTLPGATGASNAPPQGLRTNVNDDLPPPSLSIGSASAVETNTGTVMLFPVSLSYASSQTVTVSYYTSPGTATEGTDYYYASGTLTFAPGQLSQTISVNVAGD